MLLDDESLLDDNNEFIFETVQIVYDQNMKEPKQGGSVFRGGASVLRGVPRNPVKNFFGAIPNLFSLYMHPSIHI
jgi:hypothetical protein